MLTPRILLAALTALALTTAQQCITPAPPTDTQILLASSESTTVLVTDPASDVSTHRLAQSFANDIRAVVPGATVKLLNATTLASLGAKPAGENWVVLGALDGSALVGEAVNATGMDVTGTRGQWEAWTVGKGSVAGSEVVVVAGADRVSASVTEERSDDRRRASVTSAARINAPQAPGRRRTAENHCLVERSETRAPQAKRPRAKREYPRRRQGFRRARRGARETLFERSER